MVDSRFGLIVSQNYCKKPFMSVANYIEKPRSRVLLTLTLVFSLLGQSMVAFAAPCGGAGHDHEMMTAKADQHRSHDHSMMHGDHQMAIDTELSDLSQEGSMDCCGKDPSSCAMSVGIVLVLLPNGIDLPQGVTITQSVPTVATATTSRAESLYRPPISA